MTMLKKAHSLRIISLVLAALFLCANPAYSLRVPLDVKRVETFISSNATIDLDSL